MGAKVIPITDGTPRNLSAEARRLWGSLLADYDLQDAAGQALLLQLCECLDHLRACQAQIAKDGLMSRGSRGQARPHPLLREAAEARRQFLAVARSLNLDLSPPV